MAEAASGVRSVSEASRAGRAMLVADVAGVCYARARRKWIIDGLGVVKWARLAQWAALA
jgi:hypothetical protein